MSLAIAYFSPLPPQRSGIADYSAALLPYLARQVSCDVFVDTPEQVEPLYRQQFSIRSIAEFLTQSGLRWQYDACLYHMGNQPLYHEQIYQALIRYPGVVVLHEIGLAGFYLHRPIEGGSLAAFVREMGYANGLSGLQAAREIVHNSHINQAHDYPLFNRIAAVSRGIVVHTRVARARILRKTPRARVRYIPHAVHILADAPAVNQPDWLTRLPPGAVVVASFGYVAPSKRIDVVLHAVAHLRNDFPQLRYAIVGEVVDHYDLVALIQQLGLDDIVHLTGFVAGDVFEAYLQLIDIGVNLRTGPSGGEMSGGVARLLAAGRPTIVSDVDGFAELPDDCVIKISPNETEAEQLTTALRQLILDPSARAAYGESARRYAQTEFSFTRIAQSYAGFISECLRTKDKTSQP